MRLTPLKLRFRPATRGCFLAAAFVLMAVTGCGDTEQITRYSVPKQPDTPTAPALPSAPEASANQGAWFLKVTGSAEDIAAIRDDFESLVKTTQISGGSPQWNLPEGWTKESGSGMRFATLTVTETDPPLEVSVITLPYRTERDGYLLDNINRWRGQIGVEPLSGGDWMTEAASKGEVLPVDGAAEDATFVDLTGTMEGIDNARMLAAIILPGDGNAAASSQSAGPPAPMTPPPATSSADEPLTYDAPAEWQPGRKSVMRVAAFEVTDGDRKAEITVIPAGGDLFSNINRWREQVALPPWTDQQMQDESQQLTIEGEPVTYVRLEGAEQTILAAILPKGEQSWFFKLTGDPELADQEEERFKAFVESVKIK